MYSAPLDGIAEIAGLATLEPYRRRGIAAALAACAGSVYERVGFVPYATMLAYRDNQ